MRWGLGIAAGAFAVLMGAVARGQVCSESCSEYDQGTCVAHTTTCTTPAPPPPAYGAIAYGRTSMAWGYSDHWPSQSKAESVAKQNCAAHGSDCEIMVWYKNMCGAVASADGNGAYWGLGDGVGAARGAALSKCAKGGGKNCTIQVAECSR